MVRAAPGSPVEATLKRSSTRGHRRNNLNYFAVLRATSFVLQNNRSTANSQQKSLFRFMSRFLLSKATLLLKRDFHLGTMSFILKMNTVLRFKNPLNSLTRGTRRTLDVLGDALKR